MRERWEDVGGFEGRYQVSDKGRVRSYPNSRGKGFTVLSPFINDDGYAIATFSVNGRRSKHLVHRLVLLTFRGEPPPGYVACHGPKGNVDNSLPNLRWDTHSANLLEREAGYGETHGNAKLREADVMDMHVRLARGETPVSVAARYGVTVENVYMIRSGKAWRHAHAAFHHQT